jgi:hypothetical protein
MTTVRAMPIGALGALLLLGCGGGAGMNAPDGGGERSVSLRNLSARLTSKYSCQASGGATMSCGDYRFSFVLQNSAATAIARMERIELTLAALRVTSSLACPTAPWLADAGASTPVIDVEFKYLDGLSPLVTRFPCSGDTSWTADSGNVVAAPESGTAVLRVQGLLTDAAPWTAEGSAQLMDAS